LDIANEKYLNKHLILQAVRSLMHDFVKDKEGKSDIKERINNIKVFLTSNVSKAGVKGLEEHIEKSLIKRIQLVGFPNTGKTTLLNELTKLSRPTSKVPGTTIYIT
jgi:ribosome-interacting GTPase 1